jgi:hypothetical protein
MSRRSKSCPEPVSSQKHLSYCHLSNNLQGYFLGHEKPHHGQADASGHQFRLCMHDLRKRNKADGLFKKTIEV